MNIRMIALAGSLLLAGAAGAQTTTAPAKPAPLPPLPKLYAGYLQPELSCAMVKANETKCTIPAMTAGRYLVEATLGGPSKGAATSKQLLQIVVGNEACARTRPVEVAKTPALGCVVDLLTDSPSAITVRLAGDKDVVPDARGLKVTVVRLPWNGVVQSKGVPLKVRSAAPAATAKPVAKPTSKPSTSR